jgi:hypothetical protein
MNVESAFSRNQEHLLDQKSQSPAESAEAARKADQAMKEMIIGSASAPLPDDGDKNNKRKLLDNFEGFSPSKRQLNYSRPRELMTELRNQVEFYFGNSNLAKDAFMRRQLLQPLSNPHALSHSAPLNCVSAPLLLQFPAIKAIFERFKLSGDFKLPPECQPEAEAERERNYSKKLQFADEQEFAVYHKNSRWLAMDNQQKEQLLFLLRALRKSFVVKVCRDQFTLRRRIPFALTAEIQAAIDSRTVFIQNLDLPSSLSSRDFCSRYLRGTKLNLAKLHFSKQRAEVEFESVPSKVLFLDSFPASLLKKEHPQATCVPKIQPRDSTPLKNDSQACFVEVKLKKGTLVPSTEAA